VDGAEAERRVKVEAAVRAGFAALPDLFLTAVDAVRAGSGWGVRAEVVGPRVPTPAQIRGIEREARKQLGEAVHLSVRARVDVVVTGARYQNLGEGRIE
jgi:hypothetical protein